MIKLVLTINYVSVIQPGASRRPISREENGRGVFKSGEARGDGRTNGGGRDRFRQEEVSPAAPRPDALNTANLCSVQSISMCSTVSTLYTVYTVYTSSTPSSDTVRRAARRFLETCEMRMAERSARISTSARELTGLRSVSK